MIWCGAAEAAGRRLLGLVNPNFGFLSSASGHGQVEAIEVGTEESTRPLSPGSGVVRA
jgi:hypothetical protein